MGVRVRLPFPDLEQVKVKTGRHLVGLADLLLDDERRVLLAGAVSTSARALRERFALMRGHRLEVGRMKAPIGEETATQALRLPRPWSHDLMASIRRHLEKLRHGKEWHPDHDKDFWPDLGLEAADDATRKAAAVLKVPPLAVALAARARWNGVWGLTGEREHRLAVLLPGMQRETAPARKLQALRGHITRQLLQELRPLVRMSRNGRGGDADERLGRDADRRRRQQAL